MNHACCQITSWMCTQGYHEKLRGKYKVQLEVAVEDSVTGWPLILQRNMWDCHVSSVQVIAEALGSRAKD
jgi:hypothetical protein